MKKNLTAAIIAISLLASPALANIGPGRASAAVQGLGLTVVQERSVSFGRFIAGTLVGGVVFTDGTTLGLVTMTERGNTGLFKVTGEDFRTVSALITVSEIDLVDGDESMKAKLQLVNDGLILDQNGDGALEVLGSLQVSPKQPPGFYTGKFEVVVNY